MSATAEAGYPGERDDLTCPDCGALMILRPSKYGLFYGCRNFPACKGTHGAHPDGRPLGVPADRATKEARIRAHAAFDAIWEPGKISGRKRRRGRAYTWLAKRMGCQEVHMGEMTIEECERVVRLCAGVIWHDEHGPIAPGPVA
jgi:ssDNA-binding Zn-finger/Zn-ribbon topoisomerase 1